MAIVYGVLAFAAFIGIQCALYNSMLRANDEWFPQKWNDALRTVSAFTFGFSLVSLVIQAL